MNGYVCVYRRLLPKKVHRERTEAAAASDPLLRSFLERYDRSFYDWGDDPAFYCAQTLLGDVRRTSWGVCRRDVREKLQPGDLVVFFCARPRLDDRKIWDYFYVGFGTVQEAISRWQLWREDRYEPYREFYNVLVRPEGGRLVQHETFHRYHQDWRRRKKAPYILFSPDDRLSHFNVENPLPVATYRGDLPETWDRAQPLVRRLEELIFHERGIERRLRSSRTGNSHVHINLTTHRGRRRPGRSLPELREALFEVAEAVRLS